LASRLLSNLTSSGSFGIGTFLTNDFYTVSSGGTDKSKALNMVIKISSIEGKPCVKISDDLDKECFHYFTRDLLYYTDFLGLQNTGDAATVQMVKKIFGLESVDY
jgi:nicotinate phosphoribosyltransferase